ncbi:MAG: CaiB/BaiF CoA-transferase family protein [Chloroflexota bacterium]
MLEHIQILDLTSNLSGPYCTWILGALGADVIKIERPGQGDLARGTKPDVGEESIYFASVNRNKRSLTLNLKSEQGKTILKQLVAEADVLIENFRPGVMARLGLTAETLQQLNPQLVSASISGFGHTGPLQQRPAFDVVVQAMSGLMSITGPEGGPPTRVGASIGDMAAGMFAAIGILGRLVEREQREGQQAGPHIDISMLDCQLALLENAIARHLNSDETPRPLGTRHQSLAPFQAYPTADGMITIAASDEAQWQRLCIAIEAESLIDEPLFATKRTRLKHHAVLEAALSDKLRTKDTQSWLDILTEADVPCGPVQTIPQAIASQQVQARGMITEVISADGNKFELVNDPIIRGSLNQQPRPPALGEHTEEILQMLGYDEAKIEQFKEAAVI